MTEINRPNLELCLQKVGEIVAIILKIINSNSGARQTRHHLHFYCVSVRSDFKYGRQVAILENQQSDIIPELMAGSSMT
jgi:hypothetical protein